MLGRCAWSKFRVTDGQNTRDQITREEGHGHPRDQIVEVQTNGDTYMRCMRNKNLEIGTAGSSCRPQLPLS